MKSKIVFITVLFLMMGNVAIAQIDTLKVYIEKNKEFKFGVDLVFENNSNDTIFLMSRFENFSTYDTMPFRSGIKICFYSNDIPFTFNWGDNYARVFSFSKGRTLIYPNSKVKLVFNPRQYFAFPEKSKKKYEVSFFMNYLFAKYNHSDTPVFITFYETNRITIVKPDEETVKQNENANSESLKE